MATIADLRQSRQKLEHQAQQMVELAEKYSEEKDRAEEANRSKSAFLANISHELTNAAQRDYRILRDHAVRHVRCSRFTEIQRVLS